MSQIYGLEKLNVWKFKNSGRVKIEFWSKDGEGWFLEMGWRRL